MKHLPLLLIPLVFGCSQRLEDKVAGTYEYNDGFFDLEKTFYENGEVKTFAPHGLLEEVEETWKIEGKEVLLTFPDGDSQVWRLEPNGDLHLIAWIHDGKRGDPLVVSEQRHWTRKRSYLRTLILASVIASLLGFGLWWKASRRQPAKETTA